MRRAIISMAVVLGLMPGSASALELEEAVQRVDAVDVDLTQAQADIAAVKKRHGDHVEVQVGRVEERLRQAQIHFLLEDYLRAAIVLLDVVQDKASRQHPAYDEVVFLLAEALRHSHNYSGAKTYYEQLLPRAQGDRLRDVVLGLLSVAAETSRFEDVERYIGRLRGAGTLSRPDVDFIYAKMLYRRAIVQPSQLRRALKEFDAIPAGHAVSARATYYAGVCLVRMGELPEAIARFKLALSRLKKSPYPEQVKEQVYLSLGRLYQETGDIDAASEAYQHIPQSSAHFSEMLYELAWAHVAAANQKQTDEDKRRQYKLALRAVELLMVSAQGTRVFPEAAILQGNLQIRLGQDQQAYATFEGIVKQYSAAEARLREMIRSEDNPQRYFRQMVAEEQSELLSPEGLELPLPAQAFAREQPEMARALQVERELQSSARNLKSSRELVGTLEAALSGEQRFNLFPSLRQARTKALAAENALLNARRQLVAVERRLVSDKLSPAEREQLASVRAQARGVEDEIAKLPRSEQQAAQGKEQVDAAYRDAGQRAYQLRFRLSGMRAQLAGVQRWLRKERANMSPAQIAKVEQDIQAVQADIKKQEAELAVLERDIRHTKALGGGARASQLQQLRSRYKALSDQELALLAAHRAQLPEAAALFARIDQDRARQERMSDELQLLTAALNRQAAGGVEKVRAQLAEESQRLDALTAEHKLLVAQTDKSLDPVARRTLEAVAAQLHELVLKADVGIIDVAWTQKRAETERVDELLHSQQEQQQALRAEFADVLEE